jgi:hypothetical protein
MISPEQTDVDRLFGCMLTSPYHSEWRLVSSRKSGSLESTYNYSISCFQLKFWHTALSTWTAWGRRWGDFPRDLPCEAGALFRGTRNILYS